MATSIVEVLKIKSAARQTFTINAAVNEVNIDLPATGPRYMEDVYLATYFKRLDSPLLLEAGVMFPYQFSPSTEPLYVSLDWVADDGIATYVAASFTLPAGLCSLSFSGGAQNGLFLPHPGKGGAPFAWPGRARLVASIIGGKVSMVGAPSSITGDLKVIPWIRVQHSLPLEAV